MDPPLTVQQILQNQGLTVQIMQAHMVDFPFTTSYWPATGTKTVNAVLAGRKLTVGLAGGAAWAWSVCRAGTPSQPRAASHPRRCSSRRTRTATSMCMGL